MNDNDEPHKVTDSEPAGKATSTYTSTIRHKRRKLIISVDFDDSQKEFDLWDYIHDLRLDGATDIEFDTTPDYKNRIQYYEITTDRTTINRIRIWLMKNKFRYKLDK